MNIRLKRLNKLCDAWSGFSDDYFVGDDGHIYRRLKSGYFRSGKKYPYQQVRNTFGTDKSHTVHIHRAVAMAFCKRPEGATDVDHIDNDKLNNSAENLQWLTHDENLKKMFQDRKKKRKEQA